MGEFCGKPGDDLRQQVLAIEQCHFGEVVSLAIEKIEREVAEPVAAAGLQVRLQVAQIGNPGGVLDDDLAVDQRRAEAELGERVGDAAKPRRPVERVAGQEPDLAAVDARLDAIAVVLDLVDPFVPARRLVAGRRQARVEECGKQALAGAGDLADVRQQEFAALAGAHARLVVVAQPALGGKLLVRAAADARGRFLLGDLGVAGMAGEFVLGLDQQPRLGLFSGAGLDADEMPEPAQSRAIQLECQVALGEPLMGIALGGPAAAVPHDHRSSAIFALGNIAFEVEIFDRMVFGAHREPFLAEREARAPGSRPSS